MQGKATCPMTPSGLHQKQPWQAKDGRSGIYILRKPRVGRGRVDLKRSR